jgi:hypothetical protein
MPASAVACGSSRSLCTLAPQAHDAWAAYYVDYKALKQILKQISPDSSIDVPGANSEVRSGAAEEAGRGGHAEARQGKRRGRCPLLYCPGANSELRSFEPRRDQSIPPLQHDHLTAHLGEHSPHVGRVRRGAR